MHRRLLIPALFTSAFVVNINAAHAEVVTLAELEAKALQNRPALARGKALVKGADADVQKAAAAYKPQFALKADTSVGPGRQLINFTGAKESDGFLVPGSPALNGGKAGNALQPFPRSGVELSGSANLYDFGRTQAAIAAGRQGHAAAVAQGQVTEEELRAAVRETYLAWLLSNELHTLSQLTLQDAQARRARVEALINEGVRPKGELTPTRADELLAQLESERSGSELAMAKLAVERAVGSPLSSTATPDGALLSDQASLPDQSEQSARSRRALLQRFKAAQAMAEAQTKLNRPQLAIGASVGIRVSTQRTTDINLDPDVDEDQRANRRINTTVFPLYGAGLTLTVPLWDGGFTSAAVQAARAKAEEAKADLQELEQEQAFAQQKATLDLTHADARLRTADELVTICETRLKDAEAGYEAGVSNVEQIGQARALLRRAQTEALLARADKAAAKLRMVRKDVPKSGP